MKTNSLKFKTTMHSGSKTFIIKIRLDDECHNGHQDFSITGDVYEKGKPMIERNMVHCGAIGDDIAKNFPEYVIFNDLHLCDWEGIPMDAVANGLYHMTDGFNDKKRDHKEMFCEYYRITPDQYEVLKKAENKIEYAILLKELGVLDQWKVQANEAIKKLEELTGDEFVVDSVRSQYDAPTEEQIDDFIQKKASGYYSDEQKIIRAEEKRQADKQKRIDYLNGLAAEKIKEYTDDRNVSLWILNRLDKLHTKPLNVGRFNIDFSFDNFIYYNHANEVKFNWRDYGHQTEMTDQEFKMFCDSINERDFQNLPANISFVCGKIKYTRS
jgi:hypothetical protein